MSSFTIFYSILAMSLLVIWLVVQFHMVYRAKSSRVMRIILTVIAIGLLIASVVVTGSVDDKLTGVASVIILLVFAFWPKGFTKTMLIANLNTVRQFAAISKIELITKEAETIVQVFSGQIQITTLKFKLDSQTLAKFLKERFPEKRLVVKSA